MSLARIDPPPETGNSRESREGAGWIDGSIAGAQWRSLLDKRQRTRWSNFTWISPAPLLASVNDKIVKGLDDLINTIRPRWVADRRRGDHSVGFLCVDRFADAEDISFLALGDPGEQDASQYAVVAPLLSKGAETDFMVIDSDVIYPAGDVNDYIDGFYLPYRDYRHPIYAVPGNHDWYDGLNGFMFHFCGAQPLPPVQYRAGAYSWKARIARMLWRKPSPPELPLILRAREEFGEGDWTPSQPGPYFAIESRHLLLVCIDTGITGRLDREQGEWLREISKDEREKVLITGKPLYVDGEYHPGEIDWRGVDAAGRPKERVRPTVDDLVRDPRHRYVAVIGGDVHNYQRYSVTLRGEGERKSLDEPGGPDRTIEYIVSGGGGAYLSATHRFSGVEIVPSSEEDLARGELERLPAIEPIREPKAGPAMGEERFWCYPLRGDSLARSLKRLMRIATWVFPSVLIAAFLVVCLLFFPFDGFAQNVGPLENVEAAEAFGLTLGTLITLAIVVVISLGVSRLPIGSRAVAVVVTTIGLVAVIVFALKLVLEAGPWEDTLSMMLSTLLGVGGTVLGVVGYYLLRDLVRRSLRTAIALLVPIGVGAAYAATALDFEAEAAAIVAAAMLLLWLGMGIVRILRAPADNPRQSGWPKKHKWRVRLGVAIPPLLAAAAVIFVLYRLSDENFIPAGMLAALLSVILFLSCLAMIATLPFFALRRDINPDKVARWVASRLEMEPVRASARTAEVDWRTRILCRWAWLFNPIVSELAEANTPPFFKNFLRVDLARDQLTITAYGVSGWKEEETEPRVEDRVVIELSRPGTGQNAPAGVAFVKRVLSL